VGGGVVVSLMCGGSLVVRIQLVHFASCNYGFHFMRLNPHFRLHVLSSARIEPFHIQEFPNQVSLFPNLASVLNEYLLSSVR
jgi:hypothetical protein